VIGEQLRLDFTAEEAADAIEGADSLNESLRAVSEAPNVPSSSERLIRLDLENFKGFESLSASFGTFNLLVGSNNSGKSTILQAIKLGDSLLRLDACNQFMKVIEEAQSYNGVLGGPHYCLLELARCGPRRESGQVPHLH